MTDLWWPGADNQTQNFTSRFTGVLFTPNVFGLHSTEGGDWPAYDLGGTPGASAPNITYKRTAPKGHRFRGHYPLNRSSRAFQNLSGGVETNTLNVVQMEVIGTCDPNLKGKIHDAQGHGAPFVPELDDEGWDDIATFLAWLSDHTDVKIQGLPAARWKPYPASAGTRDQNGVRMTNAEWTSFYGVCGHQHVPENVHGDPGNIPIDKLLAKAQAIAGGVQDPPDDPPSWPALRQTRLELLGVRADLGVQKKNHPNMPLFVDAQEKVQLALNAINRVLGI